MKKMINTFIMIIGLMICVNVCAKTNYSDTPSFTNNYIKKFNNYQRYIVTEPVNYGFKNGNITSNGKFKTGGLLNVEEFNLSFRNGSSYLFNGLEYFTMTEESGNVVIVDPKNYNYFSSKNQSYSSGIRTTNYVQNGVVVTGKGSKIDPWMFKEKYFVRYDFDNNVIDVIPSTKNVNANDSITSNVVISNGYEYDSNNCGAVYSNGTLTLVDINNDIICLVNTKYATYTIALDSKNATTTGTTNIYEKFNTGYYLDSDLMTTSTNAIIIPTKTGYTFNGYYTEENGNGTMYIDENGKITSNASVTNFIDDGRLYANWTPITYTLSYTLNQGIVATANPTSYTIESNAITLNNPTRTGYTFKGWSGTGLTGNTNKSVTIAKGSTGNKSYTANWTAACSAGHTYNNDTKKCEYTTTTIPSYRCPRSGTADSSGICKFTGEVKHIWCIKRLGVANAYCGNYSGIDIYSNSYGNCTMNWDRTYCPSNWEVYTSYTANVSGIGYALNGKVYSCPEGTLGSDHVTCEYQGRPVYSCPSGGEIVNPNCDNGYSCSSGIEYTDGGNKMCYNPWQSTEKCTCQKNNAVNGQCQNGAYYGYDGKCYLYETSPTQCESLGYTVTGCSCASGSGIDLIKRCKTDATTVSNCKNNVCAYTP